MGKWNATTSWLDRRYRGFESRHLHNKPSTRTGSDGNEQDWIVLADRTTEHGYGRNSGKWNDRFGIAYVDVGDQQALSIEAVDFITQGRDSTDNPMLLTDALAGETTFGYQLCDLNPGGQIIFADDNTLVSSGTLGVEPTTDQFSHAADFYPDVYGKLDESRMVVNDQLYFTAIASGTYDANESADVTVRIKARIVKLSTKDWMAIAIQSTASDN